MKNNIKQKARKAEWKIQENNSLLEGDGFFISYVADTSKTFRMELTELANLMGNLVDVNFKDGEETALCVIDGKAREWLILEGDFRKEYEEAFPLGIKAVKKVYEKNKKASRSSWSTD